MSSLTKDSNRQKQVKLGALVATAALATTFAGATAVHADTVRSTPQSAGQVSQTTHSVGFESASTSTGASAATGAPATSTGSVASSAVASGAQSQAGSTANSDAATSSAVKSDAGSKATSTASGENSNASSAASSATSGASHASSAASDGKSGASSAASNSSADSSAAASDWKDTDVERHVVRTVRITTPNGRTQDYTQTVKLTRTKTEKDGKVVYSAWTDGEWKGFPLVPIDGYNWLINGKEFAPQKGGNEKPKISTV